MSEQVTLTAYADEIRELIRHNRNDEALVICHHILRYFPKHVESVRQMAEASLEKRDLDAAQDLFRRVLSSDPENAVAYVGLASIFEERQLTDEAVWHMERAFELSPTHTEIHKELLRLQGLNATRSRPRLKLTPGALARLYAHQGLLSQATQEFRAIVAGDPTRLDARTALAEMLWRTGRIHEAAEVAQDLLVPLPYCLKANLILGTAWKESGLPEGEAYLQRAQALDPTNQVAQRLLGARSPLPTIEPIVPRYVEGAAPPPVIAEEKPAPELPGEPIFATPIHAAEPSAETVTESEIELGPSPKPALPISTLPPWLRSDTSEALAFSELPPMKPTVAEEGTTLPPWMSQTQAPVVAEPAPVEEPAPPPAWMNRTEATIIEDVAPVIAEEETPVEPAMPRESQEIISEEPALVVATEETVAEPTTARESQEIISEEPAPVVATEETVAEPTAVSESQEIVSEEPAPVVATEEIVTEPTWLTQFQETISVEPATEPTWLSQPQEAVSEESAFPVTEEKTSEESLAWVSQLQETTSSDSTTLPAWLMQGEEIVAEEPAPPIAEKLPAEEFGKLPAWLTQEQEPAAEEIQVTPEVKEEFFPRETETPAENLPAETIHAAEPPVEEQPAPDWMERLRAERVTPETPPTPKESALEYPLGESVRAPAEAEIAPVPVERVAPKRARQPKGYARLMVAREHRDANRLDDALVEYDWIVQHAPRLINDVIADLEMLVRRAGVPIEAHRILGDAYTRVDRLSEALERYRFLLDRVSGS